MDTHVVLAALASPARDLYLATLLHELSISARDAHLIKETSPNRALAVLRCYNEMSHLVSGQLAASLSGETSYPDEVFLDILAEKALEGGLDLAAPRQLLDRALTHVTVAR
jgi:hypothetical protein